VRQALPPRVVEAGRFLARRGWPGGALQGRARPLRPRAKTLAAQAQPQSQGSAIWLQLGPVAVQSQNFGLVTGRVSAIALDPSDATGNTVYIGTTGGGVWRSQNADTSDASTVGFVPLTDNLPALNGVMEASISIGALTVQPGGTGVILAGTDDPNDALDSYYGVGILRSIDGGDNWSLIPATSDGIYSFAGEGFAGFAWSTVNTQLVVAAVSQALDGTLVNAVGSGTSYEGLYYSLDGGATWSLAAITDGSLEDIQGPNDAFAYPDGNAATSVVWNPVRDLFIAAVRYHGYYQSADGVTWTRMSQQPGAALSGQLCPAISGATGLTGCPIFRGTLAVNPQTGDTFAWTVDVANQDQGLWQDICAVSAGNCASATLWTPLQTQQWDTTALETDTMQGKITIEDGEYTLSLAAVPAGIGQQYGTILLAGADDVWKSDCPYSQGCTWRNTTNSTVGFCAQVGEYQHVLAWNAANPQEILIGNDSGLWRSTDAIGETGQICSSSDASHFQNLNGGLGSLAEVVSLSQVGSTPYTMMAGLGSNGTVGVKSTTGPTAEWPEILSGEGGPVAIDPNNGSNWYVNNQAGVSIHLCSQQSPCTQADFGSSPVVNDADVGGDGLKMVEPAPFLVDPLDTSQLLIGTCRVWRGGTNGTSWTAANAISSILDGSNSPFCKGDALIHSMAAMALSSGGEVIYVGMKGAGDGGATLAGHVLTATFDPASSTVPAWTDLTLNQVSNDANGMNLYGLEISSIFIDPHDSTGKTIYVTVAGVRNPAEKVQTVYGSTDGGAHWTALTSNLFIAPANSVVVDPQDANTVYVATDAGVYSTRQIANCTAIAPGCWSPYGSGLPEAPVVALSAAPVSASVQNLVAATYGRGIWTAPLWGPAGGGTGPATDILLPTTLTFSRTVVGQLSAAQAVTLTNNGGAALTLIKISVSGPFQQTNECLTSLAPQSSCAISVVYAPTATGSQTGTLTVFDAIQTQTVALSGIGLGAPVIAVNPTSLVFTGQQVGVASAPLTLTVSNTGGSPMADVGFQISGLSAASFSIGSTTCGATLVSGSSCTVQLICTLAAAGGATASLAVSSSTAGVAPVNVPLSGTGQTAAGLSVNPAQLVFGITAPGQSSASQTLTIANNGGSAATSLTITATPPFGLANNTCGTSLAAGANCSTGVVFSPALAGQSTGTLTIASGAQMLASVPLSGTGGTPGAVVAQPNQIDFPQTSVGSTSTPVTVTLTNPAGDVDLTSFSVTPSAGFKIADNSSTCPSTLIAGASCTVGVEFKPTSAGTQSGSLIVGGSLPGTGASAPGATVPLSGMGFDYVVCFGSRVTPCVISSSQTVATGQTAHNTVSIAPLGGSQGAFTLTCSSPASNSTCSLSPSSVSVSANSTGAESVEVSTGVSSSARLSRPSAWPALPLACGIMLVPLALWKRRKALLLIAMLAIAISGVSSCTSSGGGLSQPPPNSGLTPAGTYSIPITVSSGNIQHQITLTLTVD
jgi:hypothetical protein